MDPEERKAALKALKKERAAAIKANAATAKRQKADLGRIKERLAQGPATVPEIARDVDLTPRQTMWYLAALRKYGVVSEAGKNGDFFNYELIQSDPAAC